MENRKINIRDLAARHKWVEAGLKTVGTYYLLYQREMQRVGSPHGPGLASIRPYISALSVLTGQIAAELDLPDENLENVMELIKSRLSETYGPIYGH